eukprot:6208414-Pleurochrysis_carterae.AAC.2
MLRTMRIHTCENGTGETRFSSQLMPYDATMRSQCSRLSKRPPWKGSTKIRPVRAFHGGSHGLNTRLEVRVRDVIQDGFKRHSTRV